MMRDFNCAIFILNNITFILKDLRLYFTDYYYDIIILDSNCSFDFRIEIFVTYFLYVNKSLLERLI